MALSKEEQAQSGPRGKKSKDSWEYAYQTLAHLKNMYAAKEASEERFKEVLREAEEAEIYKRLPDEEEPYGDLDSMLKAELGANKKEAISEAQKWEGPDDEEKNIAVNKVDGTALRGRGRPSEKGDYSNLSERGNSRAYWTARLKRDHPEIHAALERGDYDSVRQAAIDAGIKKEIRTKQIRETDDPERAAEKVQEVYDEATISGLINQLQQHA